TILLEERTAPQARAAASERGAQHLQALAALVEAPRQIRAPVLEEHDALLDELEGEGAVRDRQGAGSETRRHEAQASTPPPARAGTRSADLGAEPFEKNQATPEKPGLRPRPLRAPAPGGI